MSAEQKPHGTKSGQPETPMQQMKDVWKRMSQDARDYWREQLGLVESSSVLRKLSDVRVEIATKLKIKFKRDERLSEFRSWLIDQDERDARAERMRENERRLKEEHPDWTMDRVREEVLRQACFETIATGNFELGLKAVSAQSQGILKERQVRLAELKFAEEKKSDQQKALEMCLEEAKEFPDVQELFKTAFAALKKAKAK